MTRLIDVYSEPSAVEFLYELLKERPVDANISHKELPAFEFHRQFVMDKPYQAWYLIQDWPVTYEEAVFDKRVPVFVGSIYLTKRNEIGLFIKREFQGQSFGSVALAMLRKQHGGKMYANIAPTNHKSICFFMGHGAKHIQNTYELEAL